MTAYMKPRRGAARVGILALAFLHLGLAFGVPHRLDAHRLEVFSRLPAAFHHHVFSIVQPVPDAVPSIVDDCLACHLSRLVPRLAAAAVVAGSDRPLIDAGPIDVAAAHDRDSPAPHPPRGPPTRPV